MNLGREDRKMGGGEMGGTAEARRWERDAEGWGGGEGTTKDTKHPHALRAWEAGCKPALPIGQ